MPTHKAIPFDSGVFSITFTCAHWLPLIDEVQGYDLIYKWFDVLKANRHLIIGYVIMPNHLHAMIGFRRSEQKINTIIGNGKRFLAYDIIKRLEQLGKLELLKELKSYVGPEYSSRKKIHQVWQYSFDWKNCSTEAIIIQKLHYYHKNPCAGKWMLAPSPEAYQHSSALFYNTGNQGVYEVTHYKTLADAQWWGKLNRNLPVGVELKLAATAAADSQLESIFEQGLPNGEWIATSCPLAFTHTFPFPLGAETLLEDAFEQRLPNGEKYFNTSIVFRSGTLRFIKQNYNILPALGQL